MAMGIKSCVAAEGIEGNEGTDTRELKSRLAIWASSSRLG
jgi:hypothetical protein